MNKLFSQYLSLLFIIICIYYNFFIFGKIPFPGDLLVVSYSPWFDYFKIPIQNPLISDVFSQFFLWKYLSIDIIKTWQWPLWNPYSFMGTPLLATYHSATLYPLNILLLFPKYLGWGLFIFSQSLIASFCMYLLLSLYVKSKLARFIGAIIFAFSSLMTTWLEFGTAGHAIAYLPLAFFAIENYHLSKKFRYLCLLVLSFIMIILAGHVQITTYSFLIIFSYIIILSLSKNFKITLVNLFYPLLGLFLAISTTALQLLPSFNLLQKSIRVSEGYINQSNFGLLPLGDFIKFYIADFFGHPVTRNYWGFLNYSETSGFIGTLTLSLVIFSLLYLRKDIKTKFFLFLLLISLFFSFDNPFSKIFYQFKIPLLTSSYASRVLFITSFSISILSSLSLDKIINGKKLKELSKSLFWVLSLIIGATLGVIICFLFLKINIETSPAKDFLNSYLNETISHLKIALRNSVLPLIQALLLLFFIKFIPMIKNMWINSNKTKLICLILCVFITFDLTRYFLKFNPFVNQSLIFPPVKELKFLQDQPGMFRIGREHSEILPPNTWIAYNIQSFEGYDPLYLLEYSQFINFLNTGNLKEAAVTRYAELYSKYEFPFLDAANVKYFVGILRDKNGLIPGNELDYRFKSTNYQVIYKGKSFAILKNPNALERIYFAPSIIVLNPKEAENLIKDEKFNPKTKVILSQNLGIEKVSGEGTAEITKYSSNLIKIKTNTKEQEVLVLADKFEEGWKAKIDDKETKISRANLIFRAVLVPPGIHEIAYYYWPLSFDIGIKVTTLSFIIILGLLLLSLIKKKF